MHFVLSYELAPDYLARRVAFREEHLALAWRASDAGELLLAGALAEPADRALLVFSGDTDDAARRFARSDPYVRHGLVTRWEVRPWTTVAGTLAATPVRPGG